MTVSVAVQLTLHAPPEDVENFGTVMATLATEPIRIDAQPEASAAFQFPIEAQPLAALLTFEIANPRIDAPPEVYLNGEDLGPVSLTLPDLADPGYRGEAEPLTTQMHFNYTGWLRAQKIVPVTALKELCEQHAPDAIDFLKIDVEGAEREVLLGGDWRHFRPKVVVVEAVRDRVFDGVVGVATSTYDPAFVDSQTS